jgi:hypothetical protein
MVEYSASKAYEQVGCRWNYEPAIQGFSGFFSVFESDSTGIGQRVTSRGDFLFDPQACT